MNQARPQARIDADCRLRVGFRPAASARELLDQPGTLAVIGFDASSEGIAADSRAITVPLQPVPLSDSAVCEHWHLDSTIEHGREGNLQWSAGGGWLFAAMTVDEREHGGPDPAAEHVYARLCAFLAERPERHVQRTWNYLADINAGDGDNERYRQFCTGRLRGMGDFFAAGFPAATAIGHRLDTPQLQVYCLAAERPGQRVENPRQISAWHYPRQYGPTPPSFARAMRLCDGAVLAISGTASITGHCSQHHGDLEAQLSETLANLHALLHSGGLAERFGAADLLKVYVRHGVHARAVQAFLAGHVPDVPHLLLLGDVCRRELLVEIEGWRYAQ